jgi:hypothetical protein
MSSARPPSTDEGRTPQTPAKLSLTQLVASALAAVSATVVASFFGVTGTLVGAAVASVVTVVGNWAYSRSLGRVHDRVQNALPALNVAAPRHVTRREPQSAWHPPWRPTWRLSWRPTWRSAAIGVVGTFVVVAGIVTFIEVAAGRPLSNLVHGSTGHGTSLFGNTRGTSSPTPSPSGTHPTTTPRTTSPATTAPSTPTSAGGPSSSSPPESASPTSATPSPTATVSGPTANGTPSSLPTTP